MKKATFLISFFFSSCAIGICQKMGIGFLKIDSTTVDDLLQTTKMRMEFETTPAKRNEGNIYQLIELPETIGYGVYGKKDPNYDASIRMKFIEGYKIFEVPILKISDLSFTNVTLIFLNDTLISFQSDDILKIEEVLVYKYGEPKKKLKTDTVYCTYTYTGVTTPYKSYELTKIWEAKQYMAVEYSENKYDDKCKEKFFSYFYFENYDKKNKYNMLCANKEKTIKEKLKKEMLGKY